jgi:hypothetical protein
MKPLVTPPFYFVPQLSSGEKKLPLSADPNLTPYLKAILSGAVKLVNAGKTLAGKNSPDLDAALRYIKESASLRK